jgi:hypothetical protein
VLFSCEEVAYVLKVNGTKVSLTRGDTAFLNVSLVDESGTAYEIQPGDAVFFRLKQNASSQGLLLEKQVDTVTMKLRLDVEDTEGLKFGVYKYEIELVTATDHHFTAIENADFEVRPELEEH